MTTTPLAILADFTPLPSALRHFAQNPGIDALYIHVPFCTTKCHYCDFYSVAGHLDQADAYLHALATEITLHTDLLGKPQPSTLFIGGGTPTLLPPPQLEQLLTLIMSHIDPSHLTEATIEANPNTFDPDRAAILRRHGINRLSFGAQSFIPSELAMLQRDHNPDNVPHAFRFARDAGFDNLNIDLIFGIPGQTLASWEYSLARALELQPTHMSCYSLTYEPNTAMTARLHRGEFAALDEDTELALFNHVYTRLRAAGFTRYEISNYARNTPAGPAVCRHNLAYWKGANWLGWGPAAGTHLALSDGRAYRWKNISSLNHYLAALTGDGRSTPVVPLTQFESPSPAHWVAEIAIFWLRLAGGLNYHEFAQRTGLDIRPTLERTLRKYADLSLLELTPDHARILEPGVVISNRILADTLTALERL